jgi:hypothetical protein
MKNILTALAIIILVMITSATATMLSINWGDMDLFVGLICGAVVLVAGVLTVVLLNQFNI